MRISVVVVLAVAGVIAAPVSAAARPASPAATLRARPASVTGAISTDRRLDTNQLNMLVSNIGWVGFDPNFGGAGLQYPRGTAKTLLYAAGLWLGTAGPNVTVAEYSSEYTSGDVAGLIPPQLCRVYKMTRWTGDPLDSTRVEHSPAELAADPFADTLAHDSWSAYMAGAAPYGAPVRIYRLPVTSTPDPSDSMDVAGPAVSGDQMLWSIYNDTPPGPHNNGAGGGNPLNAEIRQTVFAFDHPGPLGRVAYVRYQIVNRGGSVWNDAIASFWADPDIGSFADDLTGSSPDRSMSMVYNATNNDGIYGSQPPALGMDLLQGASASITYINGTDPQSAVETYNSMHGLTAPGTPIIDPISGLPSTFMFTGDPVAGTGWLDAFPADRRVLISRPLGNLAPGDSAEVWVAMVVGQGSSRLGSVSDLYCADDAAQQAFDTGFEGPFPGAGQCSAAVNCPRPPSYWQDQCNNGTQYDGLSLNAIANGADSLSAYFDWGGVPLADFCAQIAASGAARDSARREHAALLANISAGVLGLPPTGGAPIGLDPFTPVSFPPLAPGTIGDLIASPPDLTGLTGVTVYDTTSGAQGFPYVAASPGDYQFFDGGAGYAATVYLSTLFPNDSSAVFPRVRLRFGTDIKQRAYRLLRERTLSGFPSPLGDYFYAGFFEVPVSAWNLDTGEQLELVFIERAVCDDDGTLSPIPLQPPSFDSTYAPTANFDGDREVLVVLNTPYTGSPDPANMQDGLLISVPAPALYATRFRLIAPDAAADNGDHFDFDTGLLPTTSADRMLQRLDAQPQDDPAVILQYSQLAAGLAAINRGEGIGAVCNDPTPVQVSLIESIVRPDAVELSWWWSGAGAQTAAVERRETNGSWRVVGQATPDGTGRGTYVDRDVAPGMRLAYRLRIAVEGGSVTSEITEIEIPATSVLSLAGARPHPAHGDHLVIAFTLPRRAAAQLDLLDVSGRVVTRRDVGTLGVGSHTVNLSERQRIPPGVYFVRLSQSGEHISRKTVVFE